MTSPVGDRRGAGVGQSWRWTSVVTALLLLTAGCVASPSGTSPTTSTEVGLPPDGNTATDLAKNHESLDPRLAGLANATNRSAYAVRNDLPFRNGSALVVVELRRNRTLPADFAGDVRARHGRLVQAWVPATRLLSLADHENVSYVRLPREPVTERPPQNSPDNDTT